MLAINFAYLLILIPDIGQISNDAIQLKPSKAKEANGYDNNQKGYVLSVQRYDMAQGLLYGSMLYVSNVTAALITMVWETAKRLLL